ncbi:hypothetical protein F2P81_010918 [Scophthalmus maximus]|uniref:dCMP deaminase n=1 Tax=Scophthalmus maximus TaxID=52904 RepID=A0A6A4T491_SCOMX|nr:hypothetical protein F2P81_010918 [Scophthalmus maximus]
MTSAAYVLSADPEAETAPPSPQRSGVRYSRWRYRATVGVAFRQKKKKREEELSRRSDLLSLPRRQNPNEPQRDRQTEQLLAAGLDLTGKTDLRFTDTLYKVLRDIFQYKPVLTKQQFLQWGFSQRKISVVCDIINLVLQKHKQLKKVSKRAFVVNHTDHLSTDSSHRVTSPSHHDEVCSNSSPEGGITEGQEDQEDIVLHNGGEVITICSKSWDNLMSRLLLLETKLELSNAQVNAASPCPSSSTFSSKPDSSKVGACIVNEENKIVGIGYNGMPNGCDDDLLPWSRSADDKLNTKYPYVCHAELNAIMNKNSADVKGCTMYVALFPCNECAKLIIQAEKVHNSSPTVPFNGCSNWKGQIPQTWLSDTSGPTPLWYWTCGVRDGSTDVCHGDGSDSLQLSTCS